MFHFEMKGVFLLSLWRLVELFHYSDNDTGRGMFASYPCWNYFQGGRSLFYILI